MYLTTDQKRLLIRIYRLTATLIALGDDGYRYCCEALGEAQNRINKSCPMAQKLFEQHFKPEPEERTEGTGERWEPWWWMADEQNGLCVCREARLFALLMMVEIVKDL